MKPFAHFKALRLFTQQKLQAKNGDYTFKLPLTWTTMLFSKKLSSLVLLLASFCSVVQPVLAGTFVARVPMMDSAVNTTFKSINLGTSAVGGSLPVQTFYTNGSGGALSLSVTNFAVDGGVSIVTNACIGVLASGSSCALTLALDVPVAGPAGGTVIITTGNPAGPDGIALVATGVAGLPQLSTDPWSHDFGPIAVSSASAPVSFIVTNNGTASANITDIVSPSYDFPIDASPCQLVLAAGESCTFTAAFAPTGLGYSTVNLKVMLADGTSMSLTPLAGTGAQGTPDWEVPASFQFKDMVIGSPTPERTVTLHNTGLSTMDIYGIILEGDPQFVISSTTCGESLDVGQTCDVSVTATGDDTSYTYYSNMVLYTGRSSNPVVSLPLYGEIPFSSIVMTPGRLSLGNVPVGQVSAPKTVVVSNTGSLPMQVLGVTLAPNSPFSITNGCPAELAGGQDCQITVTATPLALGLAQGSLTVLTDASDGSSPAKTILLVNGIPANGYQLSTSSLPFGNLPLGQSATRTITATNLTQLPMNLTVSPSTDAAFVGSNNCTNVAVGGTCTITVSFTPTAAVTVGTNFTVTDGVLPTVVSATGTGTSAVLATSVLDLDFGAVPVGQSLTKSFSIGNSGNASTSLNLSIPSGAFSVTGGSCTAILTGGSGCTVNVTFTPTAATAYADTVTASGSPAASRTVSVHGTGAATGDFTLSSAVLPFGDVVVGQTSTQAISVLNNGNTTLTLGGITSANPAYSVTHDCSAIAVGSSCTVSVTFSPAARGLAQDNLSISSGLVTQTVALSGTGVQAELTASTSFIDFGNVVIGEQAQQQVMVTNIGNLVAGISGTLTGPFSLDPTDCVAGIQPGATCTLTLSYAPTAIQVDSGVLTVNSSTGNSLTVNVQGTGLAPTPTGLFTLSTNTLDFASVLVGDSAAQTISVLNDGNAPLTLTSVTSTNGSFSAVHNCTTVAIGATCDVTVTFQPTSVGDRTGSLTISTAQVSQTVGLHGIGVAGEFTLSTTSVNYGSVTVGQSQTATYTVTNTGGADLTLPNLVPQSAGTDSPVFMLQGTDCLATLAPGAMCSVSVTFTPNTPAGFTAVTTFPATVTGPAQSVTFTGTGIPVVVPPAPIAHWTLSSGNIDFGTVSAKTTNAQTFTITNDGDLFLDSISVATSTADIYATTSGVTGCGLGLAPGSSCTVTVTFAPTTSGQTFVDSVALSTSLLSGSVGVTGQTSSAVPIIVTGILDNISFGFDIADLGQVPVGAPIPVTVSFTNTGTVTVDVTSYVASGDAMNITIPAAELPRCFNVAPGDTCSSVVNVSFPTADLFLGTITPVAHYVDSGTGLPTTLDLYGSSVFYISGEAVTPAAAAPSLIFSATNIGLGFVEVGLENSMSAYIINQSNHAVAVQGLTLAGASTLTTTHNCGVIAAGDFCTVTVTFKPDHVGDVPGVITVTPTDGTPASTMDVQGTGGLGALIQATFSGSNVGGFVVNSSSTPTGPRATLGSVVASSGVSINAYSISIKNESHMTMTGVTAGNTDAGLQRTSSTCNSTLAPGGSCVVSFKVLTAVTSPYLSLVFNATSGDVIHEVVNIGYTSTPPYTLSSINFGTMTWGQSSQVGATLTNVSSQASSIALAMPSASFSVVGSSGNCLSGTLAANSSCNFTVRYSPPSSDVGRSSFPNMVFTGTLGTATGGVSATVGTPPPPPPPPAPVTPTAVPSGSSAPALNLTVITNQQMVAQLYGGTSGHYFSSYSTACWNANLSYSGADNCMLLATANALKVQYGNDVVCQGIQYGGPYPYVQSWGYRCRN